MDRRRSKRRGISRPNTNPVEMAFGAQLRKIPQQIGMMIDAYPPGDPEYVPTIVDLLTKYAEIIVPWATKTAFNMLTEVDRRDKQAWFAHSNEISQALRAEIRNAPTGAVMQALLAEQVTLIKSLPLDAAKRVHDLTLVGIEDGTRAKEIAKEIARSREVSMNRATLIARTEVSRTSALLTQARAEHIGSPGYIWTTSHDSDVRSDHRELDGKMIAWNDPPVADKRTGARAHAGCIYNCRCWANVIVPDL